MGSSRDVGQAIWSRTEAMYVFYDFEQLHFLNPDTY